LNAVFHSVFLKSHMMRRSATICLGVTWLVMMATSGPAAQPASPELSPELRDKALGVLREGLKSEEFWPAMHAAEALTIAGKGSEVRQALAPLLETERDDQHLCGLGRELTRAGDRFKAQMMLGILASDNDYGHVHAAESLYKVAEIGDGRLLRQAMQQTANLRLRAMAAAALARCGSPRALAVVRELGESDDAETRKLAAWILARLGTKEDLPLLRKLEPQATDAIGKAYVWFALAMLGDEQGRQKLAESLQSTDPAVRTYAAEMAGHSRLKSAHDVLVRLLDDEVLDVRVRAAQSLFLLSQPSSAAPTDISRDVYQATKEHPRYSEGSIARLADGSLLYATTEFAESASDFAAAQIVARTSSDGGQTWGPQRVLQENVGRNNVMSASLARLASPTLAGAPLGLFFARKNGPADLQVYLRTSTDEGRTFGPPTLVSASGSAPAEGYHVINNDRVLRLTSGRLVCPVAWTSDVKRANHFVSFCYLSDDAGRTWHRGRGQVDLPKRGAMEPGVVELDDGGLMMIVRTQLGNIAVSRSADGGETWSDPQSWGVASPESPATVKRLPATGDLLLVWNNSYSAGQDHGGKRTPLVAALSTDEGRTWQPRRVLENRTDQTYAYTSLLTVEDRVLLSYYVRDEQSGRISSRFRSLPLAWFYEQK
jgi:sialidase-1